MLQAKSPRNLFAGLTYLAFGSFVLSQAWNYPMGTLSNMRTGYFPIVFAVVLIGFGLISIAQSVFRDGDPLGRIALKPTLIILSSIALFAFALPYLGLVFCLTLLVLLCALASPEFRLGRTAVAGMFVLVAANVIVFTVLLNIPMPLFGSWLSAV